MLKIGIIGASGKMGQELVKIALKEASIKKCCLIGASVRNTSLLLGRNIGMQESNIYYSDNNEDIIKNANVIIDFTSTKCSLKVAEIAAQYKVTHICGTTGFLPIELDKMKELAKMTTIFLAPNMNVNIFKFALLIEKAAMMLDNSFDIEILETHHRFKVDAPSGTALMLGEAAAKGRKLNFETVKKFNRAEGYEKRETDSIGFASMRGGGVIGEHSINFLSQNEKIELTHVMFDRRIYADSAFRIAYWAQTQSSGKLLTMKDYMVENL